MKNKLAVTVAASALAVTSLVGLGTAAFAADSPSTSGSSASTSLEATRKATDADKGPGHHEQAREDMAERLTQAVSDGTITQEQKELIEEFLESHAPDRQEDKNLSKEEGREAHEQRKQEVEEFAQENDIPVDLLRPAGPGKGGPGGRDKSDCQGDESDSAKPSDSSNSPGSTS